MGQPSPPQAPNLAKDYKQGIQIYLKYLPKMLRQEMEFRNLYDPKRIAEQQALQAQFGPTMYNQQLAALKQLDPQGFALRQSLADQISQALQRGGTNPQQIAAYNRLGQLAMQGPQIDPTQAKAYQMLGQSVTGQLNRGTQLDPAFARQLQQTLRAGQSARGNIYGAAPASAEALYQGQRAQQLLQQRQGATQNFLGLSSPTLAAKQLAYANLAGFTGMQSPQERSLAQAGSFLSLPTPEAQIGMIQGVAPDRASAYVNPNAGYLGQQGGLQNYQNQLAAYQAGGGATNPWMNALQGSASGAASGAMFGGYGAIAGGLLGGLSGYFSDRRLKQDIVDTGERTRDGIPIMEFSFIGFPSKRYRGVMAQDVLLKRPDCVKEYKGYLTVDHEKLGVRLEEITDGMVASQS